MKTNEGWSFVLFASDFKFSSAFLAYFVYPTSEVSIWKVKHIPSHLAEGIILATEYALFSIWFTRTATYDIILYYLEIILAMKQMGNLVDDYLFGGLRALHCVPISRVIFERFCVFLYNCKMAKYVDHLSCTWITRQKYHILFANGMLLASYFFIIHTCRMFRPKYKTLG